MIITLLMNLTKPLRLDSCRAEKVNRDTVRSRRTKHVVVNSILKGGPPLRVCRRDRSVGFEMVPLEKKEVGRARAAARAWTARPRPAGSDMILEKKGWGMHAPKRAHGAVQDRKSCVSHEQRTLVTFYKDFQCLNQSNLLT